jgi:sulfonate transport system ATP-binding protein
MAPEEHRSDGVNESSSVRVRNLSVTFGENAVLRELDLDIAPGEFVALLGRSGSGKTTLLRVLAGLQTECFGALSVPRPSSVVFQEPRLLPWKRIVENVAIGMYGAGTKESAIAALREVGLEHRLDAWPSTLSGGEAQRAGLARAIVRNPKFLLLDEPFASIDALTRLRMHDLILELWSAHQPSVMLVTHDVDEALLLADRIVVLDAGRIAADITVGLSRPRQATHARFAELRERILVLLGVNAAAPVSEVEQSTPHVTQPTISGVFA